MRRDEAEQLWIHGLLHDEGPEEEFENRIPEPDRSTSEEDDRVHKLDEALAKLTDKQRYVIELSWGLTHSDHSFSEIAEIMGTTTQAVHSMYTRAMKTLRRVMEDEETVKGHQTTRR